MAGVLLNDSEMGSALRQSLKDTLAVISSLSSDLQRNDNAIGLFTKDAEFGEMLRTRLTSLLEQTEAFVAATAQSKGLLYRLTQDEEYGERVAANLEKASFHLASILEKIDEGDGSASLLLNDPSLYQGIYHVVYGLEHSGLSKWYIQSKRKKGDRLIEQEEQKP